MDSDKKNYQSTESDQEHCDPCFVFTDYDRGARQKATGSRSDEAREIDGDAQN